MVVGYGYDEECKKNEKGDDDDDCYYILVVVAIYGLEVKSTKEENRRRDGGKR